jgi:organic hydroperoxide reductase OsmC/OhrA
MIQYPLVFRANAEVVPGIVTPWKARASENAPLTLSIPPEFDGPGGGFSPEDLYALALLNCFGATFKVIAERSRVDYRQLTLSGALIVDRNEAGAPWMKRFELEAVLEGATDRERADRVLQKTSTSCLILNSVKTEVTFSLQVKA